MKIGIDFGTGYSYISALSGNPVGITPHAQKEFGEPTVIYCLGDNKTLLTGSSAKKRWQDDSAYNTEAFTRYAINIKRMFRTRGDHLRLAANANNYTDGIIKMPYNARRLIETFLSDLIKNSFAVAKERGINGFDKIDSITIGVPASATAEYSNPLRDILTKVCADLGFKNVEINVCDEPILAALAYFMDNKPSGKKNILLFDIGAGTSDAAILSYDSETNTFKTPVTPNCDCNIGGCDFDISLYKLICKAARITFNKKIPAEHYELVVQKKHALSEAGSVFIMANSFGEHPRFEIKLNDFIQESKDDLAAALKQIKKVIDKYQEKNSISNINEVILVGGASRMPMILEGVREVLREKGFQESFIYDENKVHNWNGHESTAIAEGAAFYTSNISCKSDNSDEIIISAKNQFTYAVSTDYGAYEVLRAGDTFTGKPIPKVSDSQERCLTLDKYETSHEFFVYECKQGEYSTFEPRKISQKEIDAKLKSGSIKKLGDASYKFTLPTLRTPTLEYVSDRYGRRLDDEQPSFFGTVFTLGIMNGIRASRRRKNQEHFRRYRNDPNYGNVELESDKRKRNFRIKITANQNRQVVVSVTDQDNNGSDVAITGGLQTLMK